MSKEIIEAIGRRTRAYDQTAAAYERLATGMERIAQQAIERERRRALVKKAVEIMKEREKAVAQWRAIRDEAKGDKYPQDYRERRHKEAMAQIRTVNDHALAEVRQWAEQMTAEPRRRFEEGMPAKQEELLEAGQLAERFKGEPGMARRQLLGEARRLLGAGATSRAAVYYRAATIVGVQDEQVAAALTAADPVKVSARHELAAIGLHVAVLEADIHREAARFDGDMGADIRDKFTAVRWGLTPAEQLSGQTYREMVLEAR